MYTTSGSKEIEYRLICFLRDEIPPVNQVFGSLRSLHHCDKQGSGKHVKLIYLQTSHQLLWICNISNIFFFLYFLQSLMEFKDFLYVQVSITLHYFLFELGFIHTFYIIFPQYLVSGIWYLIFVYVKPNILPFLFQLFTNIYRNI